MSQKSEKETKFQNTDDDAKADKCWNNERMDDRLREITNSGNRVQDKLWETIENLEISPEKQNFDGNFENSENQKSEESKNIIAEKSENYDEKFENCHQKSENSRRKCYKFAENVEISIDFSGNISQNVDIEKSQKNEICEKKLGNVIKNSEIMYQKFSHNSNIQKFSTKFENGEEKHEHFSPKNEKQYQNVNSQKYPKPKKENTEDRPKNYVQKDEQKSQKYPQKNENYDEKTEKIGKKYNPKTQNFPKCPFLKRPNLTSLIRKFLANRLDNSNSNSNSNEIKEEISQEEEEEEEIFLMKPKDEAKYDNFLRIEEEEEEEARIKGGNKREIKERERKKEKIILQQMVETPKTPTRNLITRQKFQKNAKFSPVKTAKVMPVNANFNARQSSSPLRVAKFSGMESLILSPAKLLGCEGETAKVKPRECETIVKVKPRECEIIAEKYEAKNLIRKEMKLSEKMSQMSEIQSNETTKHIEKSLKMTETERKSMQISANVEKNQELKQKTNPLETKHFETEKETEGERKHKQITPKNGTKETKHFETPAEKETDGERKPKKITDDTKRKETKHFETPSPAANRKKGLIGNLKFANLKRSKNRAHSPNKGTANLKPPLSLCPANLKPALNVRTRRLMKEFKVLNRSCNQFFTVDLVNDCLDEWMVRLFGVDHDSLLYRDMQELEIAHIELSLSFPDNFPFHPPFLRVLAPRLEKGFVMEGGAVCMELLTPRGWASAYTIEAVIMQVAASLVKGQGRICRKNKSSSSKEFSRRSAETAFRSLVRTHERYGWVTPSLSEG